MAEYIDKQVHSRNKNSQAKQHFSFGKFDFNITITSYKLQVKEINWHN